MPACPARAFRIRKLICHTSMTTYPPAPAPSVIQVVFGSPFCLLFRPSSELVQNAAGESRSDKEWDLWGKYTRWWKQQWKHLVAGSFLGGLWQPTCTTWLQRVVDHFQPMVGFGAWQLPLATMQLAADWSACLLVSIWFHIEAV